MDRSVLLSKFRGSMLAALAGDCIGALYENGWSPVPYNELTQMDAKLKKRHIEEAILGTGERPLLYTDDTEMAHVLAQSLIANGKFVPEDVAFRFARAFLESPPHRCYGGSVCTVFAKLLTPKYASDPFRPATEQFNGLGSYGNGSAMRVFPVALYSYLDQEKVKEISALSAKITHAHIDAVNGAIMQAMAVQQALSSSASVTWKEFWKKLKEIADVVESNLSEKSYTCKLVKMYEFLDAEYTPAVSQIEVSIGTGIKATEAVSAASYAFLVCLAGRQPAELSSFSKVQQAILYAISLGGDTDTIATMTGAIAGAFYGAEGVPQHWLSALEGEETANNLAKQLFDMQ